MHPKLLYPIPEKILVIKLRSMGDSVITTSTVMALKQLFPAAEVHVAVSYPWGDLLEGHPYISKVWKIIKSKKVFLQTVLKFRREHYDAILSPNGSPYIALIAWFTGVRIRVIQSHDSKAFVNFINTHKVPDQHIVKPATERDLDVIRALGYELAAPITALAVDQASDALIKEELKTIKRPLLSIGIGASKPTKKWPGEKFAALISYWLLYTKGSVIIPYREDEDAETIHLLKTRLPDQDIIYKQNPSVKEMAAMLANSDIFCGNDSGPKHVAVAMGVPTLTFFGPEDPYEWHPYDRKKHPILYIEGLECRTDGPLQGPHWCGLRECVVENNKCLNNISPESAWVVLQELSQKFNLIDLIK